MGAAELVLAMVAGVLPELGTWDQMRAEDVGEEDRVKPHVLGVRTDLLARVPVTAGMVFVRDWWVRLEELVALSRERV
jgi:hypothetical protein